MKNQALPLNFSDDNHGYSLYITDIISDRIDKDGRRGLYNRCRAQWTA